MASTQLICIVDDDADYRFLVQHLLNRYFPAYSVLGFTNGKEFLAQLPQMSHRPDLILLDRHMPELDGHQTLLRLKQHPDYSLIPVVMMSAHASAAEVQGCYEAGVNSFLMKPVGSESLKEIISTVFHYWLGLNRPAVY